MANLNIFHVDELPTGAFPAIKGVTKEGAVETKAVVAAPDRPLWLWSHALAPGAALDFERPAVGHVLYVWKGGAIANNKALGPEGVVCVEHEAQARIVATEQGATILHFHQSTAGAGPSSKAGGHVHAVGSNGILKVRDEGSEVTTTVWADATCATCKLWLHKSDFAKPRPQMNPHFHTEDEIIFVVRGGMLFGRRTLAPGTALAIDAKATYGFGVDEGGLAFINFRPDDPYFVMMGRDGPKHAPISERENMSRGSVLHRGRE